jgi:hypothetical protein
MRQSRSSRIQRRRVLRMSNIEVLRHIVAPLRGLGGAGARCIRMAELAYNGNIAARGGLGPLISWLIIEGRPHRALALDMRDWCLFAEIDLTFWLTGSSAETTRQDWPNLHGMRT